MVCRFIDGFDYYSTSDIVRKWTSKTTSVVIDTGVKRTGSGSLKIPSSNNVALTLDNQASWVMGFALRLASLGTSSKRWFIQFIDDSTVQCSLTLNSNGTLEIVRGTSTAVTDGVSSLSLSTDTWYYVEVKVTIADSIGAGTCVVKVNGATWITVATGQDLKSTANATANKIGIVLSTFSPSTSYYDDLYIFDGTGSENNDFAGDVSVVTQLPNANGSTNDFLGSDADSVDNYLHVDETDTDDDTSFVGSSTNNQIDLYEVDDLAVTPSAIHAVQINNVVKKDEAGSRAMRSVVRPVTTNLFGSVQSPSNGSYSNEITIYDLNPELSVAWTESTFNATEFGIEVQP